jgi:hypothetical protein
VEGLTQQVEILGQVRFLDDRIVPYTLYQSVLANDSTGLHDQDGQRFDHLWSKRKLLVIAIKHQLTDLELKLSNAKLPLYSLRPSKS